MNSFKTLKYNKILFFGICLFVLFLTFPDLYAQSIDEVLQKGIKLREKGDLDKSLEILKQAEKQDKKNSEVLYNIALTYLKKGEIVDRISASDYLEKALKIEPHPDHRY